jgi:hypothetical protein
MCFAEIIRGKVVLLVVLFPVLINNLVCRLEAERASTLSLGNSTAMLLYASHHTDYFP